MKILFAASECVPFIKTGGLADVVGALAPVLARKGHDVRVILPKYGMMAEEYRQQLRHVTDFYVKLGWRHQYCGIEALERQGVTFYFVDNEYYFKRNYIYGLGGDEYERFGFFCRAVLDALPRLDFQPDVIHAHDWQSGMVPALLRIQYDQADFYHNIRTVFTIHNLQYQGVFGIEQVKDVLELPDDVFTNDKLECFGCANFMKAALVYANEITTVSPSYAEEIQTAYYGERLDGLLRAEPWVQVKDRKFLCPVPGYDRHFAMTEHFGFQLIPIPMHNDGPDMDMIEDLVQRDASIKGIWCVPKYQNPTGIVFSPMVVERFAHLQPAAPDFRIFWDNAYCVHDLYPNAPAVLPDILSACANAGHPDMVYEFCSTSKVSFPGAGISGVAASSANLIDLRKVWKFATIGPDKLNQLRQARFFRNESGIEAHMARHARLLRPKFEQVISIFREELDGSGIASWTEPRGGYFLSFDTMPGCAARTVELCRRAGVKFTPAGSTWPYGRDPQDSNVRIAPSFASAEEIEPAARLFTICVRLATLEKLAATRFASETALGAERIA